MEKRTISINIISSLLLQLFTMMSGFILPRIIISSFGSEVNGLVSSINQFLNYVALLEGGVSSVITASLYKPLRDKDYRKISGIINATQRFFRQIGFIFIIYMTVVAFVYPLLVKTKYTYKYVIILIYVLGSTIMAQYFLSLANRILIRADRKVYCVSFVQTLCIILNFVLVLVSVKYFRDILVVKFVSALVFLVQPIMFGVFVKKHYPLDRTIPPDSNALKQRWDGFGQNIAYFIHSNTDIVLLTVFSTLPTVSVYAVYSMVVVAIKNLVISVSSSITPSIGNILASKDEKKINSYFELYEFGMFYISAVMFSCCLILIVPFVGVYTAGITDVNYHQPIFGWVLVLSEMIYCIRDPYVSVAYSAGKFKETSVFAIVEAVINIVLSLVLVIRFNLLGVAIGTLVAMTVRTGLHINYLKKYILNRSRLKAVKKIIVFAFACFISIIISSFFRISEVSTFTGWSIKAMLVFFTTMVVVTVFSAFFYRNDIVLLFEVRVNRSLPK